MTLRRFLIDRSGAALVEFALALPLFLVLFAATIDGARMLWSYQTAVAGVRDATRYLGRTVPMTGCPASLPTGIAAELLAIVEDSAQGTSVTPSGVTVLSVVPSVSCDAGTAGTYRNGPVSVATVTATLRIEMPFSGLFQLVGGSADVGTFDATVSDSTRIFGS